MFNMKKIILLGLLLNISAAPALPAGPTALYKHPAFLPALMTSIGTIGSLFCALKSMGAYQGHQTTVQNKTAYDKSYKAYKMYKKFARDFSIIALAGVICWYKAINQKTS